MWGLIGKRLEETFRGDGNVSFLDRDLYACAETQQKYTYFKKIYTKKWNIYAHFSLLMMIYYTEIFRGQYTDLCNLPGNAWENKMSWWVDGYICDETVE